MKRLDPTKPLTAPECAAFSCPPEKRQDRLHDSGGLYLEALRAGGKYWRVSYTFGGKDRTYTIGVFRDFSLSKARLERNDAKGLLAKGIDPTARKRITKLLKSETYVSFADCARNYIKKHPEWSASHLERVTAQLDNDVLPFIGKRPMKDIEGVEIFDLCNTIVERDAIDSAHKTLGIIHSIYELVILDGIPDATVGVKVKLPKIIRGHHAAIIEPTGFAQLLRTIENYQGSPEVKAALKIAPILFQRPNNVRYMQWRDIDLENKLWTIPKEQLKLDAQERVDALDHLVPLPTQVVETLQKMKLAAGQNQYVFRSSRGKAGAPFSENTIGYALIGMGYKDIQTFHGFRASGRTIGAQELDIDANQLEAQLAHKVKDPNGEAYNRAKWVKHRRVNTQKWADYLDEIKLSTNLSMV